MAGNGEAISTINSYLHHFVIKITNFADFGVCLQNSLSRCFQKLLFEIIPVLSTKRTTSYSLLRGMKVEEVQNQLRETAWASGLRSVFFIFSLNTELMTGFFFSLSH